MELNVGKIQATVDEHGRIINQQGEQISGLELVVIGDKSKHVRGLLARTDTLEQIAQELSEWRQDIATTLRVGIVYLRVLAILLGLTGLAVWRDGIMAIIVALGG